MKKKMSLILMFAVLIATSLIVYAKVPGESMSYPITNPPPPGTCAYDLNPVPIVLKDRTSNLWYYYPTYCGNAVPFGSQFCFIHGPLQPVE